MVFAKAFTNRDPLIFTALNNSSQINFNHSLVGLENQIWHIY